MEASTTHMQRLKAETAQKAIDYPEGHHPVGGDPVYYCGREIITVIRLVGGSFAFQMGSRF